MTDTIMVHIEYIRQSIDKLQQSVEEISGTYPTRREYDADIKTIHRRIDSIHSKKRANIGVGISILAVLVALAGVISGII